MKTITLERKGWRSCPTGQEEEEGEAGGLSGWTVAWDDAQAKNKELRSIRDGVVITLV